MAETVRKVLKLASDWLAPKGVDAPRLDAELLLAHVLKVRRLDLYLDHDRPLEEKELAPYRALLKRRAAREPVAYLLGEREFFGLPFFVSNDVLVPRPDTELLVEVARDELKKIAPSSGATFVDVGTGSGCIAIALLKEVANVRGIAVDLSEKALAVAKKNAERHGVALDVRQGDLLAPVSETVQVVVSNPPYILPGERASLAPELGFEPEKALFDEDGLPLTARLAREARRVLASGGLLAIETGQGSAALVRRHLEEAGFVSCEVKRDLAGVERVVLGRAPLPDAPKAPSAP